MDRVIVYPGQVPLETDILNTNKNTMIAIGRLAALAGGAKPNTSAWAEGLAVTQTSPASLTVNIGPGSMYASQVVDSSVYSSLPSDTANTIPKQGINLGTSTVLVSKTGLTAGNKQYVVIAAQIANPEDSLDLTVLPYYNSNSSSVALNGPSNTGTSQPRRRSPTLSFSAVYGTPVPTAGAAVVPTLSAGQIGLAKILLQSTTTQISSAASTSTNAQIEAHDDEPRNVAPYASLGVDNKFTGIQTYQSSVSYKGTVSFDNFNPTSAVSTTNPDCLMRRADIVGTTGGNGNLYLPITVGTDATKRILFNWGSGTYTSSTAGAAAGSTTLFPVAFSSNVFAISVQPTTNTAAGATMWVDLVSGGGGSFTGFNVRGTTASGTVLSSCAYKWYAVGI